MSPDVGFSCPGSLRECSGCLGNALWTLLGHQRGPRVLSRGGRVGVRHQPQPGLSLPVGHRGCLCHLPLLSPVLAFPLLCREPGQLSILHIL